MAGGDAGVLTMRAAAPIWIGILLSAVVLAAPLDVWYYAIATQPPAPPQGYYLAFPGTNAANAQIVNAPTTYPTNLTLCAWIHPAALPQTNAYIVSSYSVGVSTRGASLIYRTNGVVNTLLYCVLVAGVTNTSSITSSVLVATGAWSHVALTYAPTVGVAAYLNGVEFGRNTNNLGTIVWPVITNWGFGARAYMTTNSWFPGGIDDVRIYNVALASNDILALAQGADITNGLIGNWQFNEGAGTNIFGRFGPSGRLAVIGGWPQWISGGKP